MDDFLAEARARVQHWADAVTHWWQQNRPGWMRRRPQRMAPERAYATVFATRDDDVSSITGRIDTAADIEVVLIVPRAARWMRQPSAWPHIAAHVRRRGITLGVVSQRRDVRAHARQNGLRAENSIARLFRRPGYRLRLGEREIYIPRIPWGPVVRGSLLIGVIVAGLFAACYSVPSAEVFVAPLSQELTSSMRVQLNALVDEADVETGVIPAESVNPTIVALVSTNSSGSTEVGDAAAKVELEFTNHNGEPVAIPAGIIVETESGVGFGTDAPLEIGPRSSATVAATALMPGTEGNVPAESIRGARSGSLPQGVTVVNFEEASGGTNKVVPAVAGEDIDRVHRYAEEVLRRAGTREVERLLQGGIVVPQTLSVAISNGEPLLEVGEPSEVFLMEYKAVVSALVLTQSAADRFAEQMLQAVLPPDMALLPETAHAEIGDNVTVDGDAIFVEMVARGRVTDVLDTEAISSALVGVSPAEAQRRLGEMLRLEAAPRIELEPSFIPWRWLPRRADRIEVLLASRESLEGESDEGESSEATPTAPPVASSN